MVHVTDCIALGAGFEGIRVVTGPMGRNIPDLIVLMKVLPFACIIYLQKRVY